MCPALREFQKATISMTGIYLIPALSCGRDLFYMHEKDRESSQKRRMIFDHRISFDFCFLLLVSAVRVPLYCFYLRLSGLFSGLSSLAGIKTAF